MNHRGAHLFHRIAAFSPRETVSSPPADFAAGHHEIDRGGGGARRVIEATCVAKLPYVPDPAAHAGGRSEFGAAGPGLAEVYGEVRALGRPLLNLYRVLANQPAALRAFLGMSRYVRNDSALPPRLRELAILATAYALGVRYEQVHHLAAARSAGVAEEKLRAFPAWPSSPAFEPAERAVMTYAHEVATSRRAADATFADVRRHLSQGQVVDLAMTVAWYHLCAAILLPLDVDLEE